MGNKSSNIPINNNIKVIYKCNQNQDYKKKTKKDDKDPNEEINLQNNTNNHYNNEFNENDNTKTYIDRINLNPDDGNAHNEYGKILFESVNCI